MMLASELKQGMAIRFEDQVCKVIEVESKAGAAKMTGVVKTKLLNVRNGHIVEPHFRPGEKLEELELERRLMEFLYTEGDVCTFMHPETFEQIEIPSAVVGLAAKFLEPGMELPVNLFAGEPISVIFPDVLEVRVATTTPASHSPQDNAGKEATLENGLEVRVPLFVAPGDMVRVDSRTGRYVERARAAHKFA